MADKQYININLKSDIIKYNEDNVNVKFKKQYGGNNYDIKITKISQQIAINGYETNNLVINFSGKSINHVILNTIKRCILTLIPIYAFEPSEMIFGQNTSIFNNDYMRLRLSNFPIYFSSKFKKEFNNSKTLDEAKILEYRANIGSREIDETTLLDLKFDRENFMMTINVKNNSSTDIMNVETNTPGVNFYWNNDKIDHPYETPLLIIQLQPNQVFNVTCKSSLNIALKNAIYRCCSLCYYTEDNNNQSDTSSNYTLYLHSRRQINEKEILIRACKIIIQKINLSINIIIKNINDKFIEESLEGTIELDGEYHTLSNLITRFLQDHSDIEYAGYAIGHPSVATIKIDYIAKDSISKILKDIQNNIINLFTQIMNKIEEL